MPKSKKRTAAELKQARCGHIEPIAYTVQQFAHAAGISPRLLYDLWQEKKGPPYVVLGKGDKHGRRLIPRAGGEEWLASRSVS
jgi:hypothetical protein